jgi:protein transport protein SEC61 subunit gamma-like protein
MEETIDVQPQGRFRRFIKECARVIHITKKPSKEEYKNTLKITAIGAAIVGALGFIIFLIRQLLF